MYDVIIVGARLAGASTAMLLSRSGHRVLLLDRSRLPGKPKAATNLIHPPGVLRLKNWGLLDDVMTKADAPKITHYGLRSGEVDMVARLPQIDGVDFALPPRRQTLDEILLGAAVSAGVELRTGVTVHSVIRDGDGVVIGVTGRNEHAVQITEYAEVVVGADGANSRIASLVGAAKYHDVPVLNKSYFAYWKGLPRDGVVHTYRHDRQHASVWPTHDGMSFVAIAYPVSSFRQRGDDELDACAIKLFDQVAPELGAQLRESTRVGKWLLGSVGNFIRRPQGPGWALVGDAGYCRDPITASGITDALRSAERLAEALDHGITRRTSMAESLLNYEQRRDRAVVGHFAYTCDFATVADHTREEKALIAAMCRSPWHASGMVGVFSGVVEPEEFYSWKSFCELFEYMGPRRKLGFKLGLVDLLMHGIPGRPRWASSIAVRLIARNLGPMGPYLLDDSPPSGCRPVGPSCVSAPAFDGDTSAEPSKQPLLHSNGARVGPGAANLSRHRLRVAREDVKFNDHYNE